MPETSSPLNWHILSHNPFVLEAEQIGKIEYHVTIADDGEIRGQMCRGFRQVWVSDPASSYDEAKSFCEQHSIRREKE